MLGRLFPKQFDNNYRGYALAIWILAAVALAQVAQSTTMVVMTREVIAGADRVPLDKYDPTALQTILALFALSGVHRIVLPLQCLWVVIRYRSMIPLMFVLLFLVQVGGRLVLFLHPMERSEGPRIGATVNLVLLGLILIGLALSLSTPRSKATTDTN